MDWKTSHLFLLQTIFPFVLVSVSPGMFHIRYGHKCINDCIVHLSICFGSMLVRPWKAYLPRGLKTLDTYIQEVPCSVSIEKSRDRSRLPTDRAGVFVPLRMDLGLLRWRLRRERAGKFPNYGKKLRKIHKSFPSSFLPRPDIVNADGDMDSENFLLRIFRA